jgi:hypothetical protein
MTETTPQPSQKKAYVQPTLQSQEQLDAVTEGGPVGSAASSEM